MEHLEAFETFFDYESTYHKTPKVLLASILDKAKKYLPVEQLSGIEKAFAFASAAHQGVVRKS